MRKKKKKKKKNIRMLVITVPVTKIMLKEKKKISAGKARDGISQSTNDFKRKERTASQCGNPYFAAKAGLGVRKSLRVPTDVPKDFGLELAKKIILQNEQW